MSRRFAPLALALLPAALAAQEPMTGYSAAAAARQRAAEAAAVRVPTPDRARDYVIAQMRALGMQTEVRTYRVYMPHATAVHVWRVSPDMRELDLSEPAVPGDSTSGMAQYPAVNGFSAAGDVTGEVVYVNYGLIEDYARLDSLGVSVRGKIAIARYGRSFRGIKAREAERNGAAALIIYSDPANDGYQAGEVYPEGPMRPADAIQRGSVLNGDGDPSTPGWASVDGARRLPEAEMEIPRIPVVPMAYGDAAELLRGLAGTRIPADWQGGLPFRYHVGPGPVVARVQVQTDAATHGYKEIHDTFGVIRGSEFPDEIVVIGGHRDGWGPGAADNVSGTVSVIEAARAVMEQARAGNPPRRTMLFATWDAEEWGLFGSTEFVEQDSARLSRGAVAYLNQDVAATGLAFGGGGSPSLRATLRSVARVVPDPSGEGSVYQAWRRREAPADSTTEPSMEDPGGGSDFAGFYNHLGIPHSEWGFTGPYGVYHSQYDSFEWMRRFGDPEFRAHAAAAQVGAALMLRLANADVLPYDYAEFARTMRGYLPMMDAAIGRQGITASTAGLGAGIEAMRMAAIEFASARDAALAAGAPGRETLRRTNAALMRVERALTRPEGLRTRPWFRALIYAADENNGYSNVVFPSISEAARDRDAELAVREIADLAARFESAAAALRDARAALGGR